MLIEQTLSEGLRSDHRYTKLDSEIKRLLSKEVLDDADRFNWFYLTSPQEDHDAYNGTRFD